jgi:hypothetical protein
MEMATKLQIVDANGHKHILPCDNFTWNVDTQMLALYEVLEEGEYKASELPGRLDVIKQAKSRIIGSFQNPQYWLLVEDANKKTFITEEKENDS